MNIKEQILTGNYSEEFNLIKDSIKFKIEKLVSGDETKFQLSNTEIQIIENDDDIINLCQEQQILFGCKKSDVEKEYSFNGTFEEFSNEDELYGFPVVFVNCENSITLESCYGISPEDQVITSKAFMHIL